MKVSIWRQFSSNHSANYTIVGVFPTGKQAAEMGSALKKLVTDIRAWREQNSHKRYETSPIEIESEQVYGIEWQESIDWLYFDERLIEPFRCTPDQHIVVQDNFVLVDAPGASHTWQTGHQFAKIMQARGADIFHEIYMGEPPNTSNVYRFAEVHFNLHISVPDNTTANEIFLALNAYLTDPSGRSFSYQPMPWAIYHDRAEEIQHKLNPVNYAQQEALWLREEAAQHAYARQRKSRLDKKTPWTQEERAECDALRTQEKGIADHINLFRWETRIHSATVTRKDRVIELEAAHPIYALASLMGWLHALDCEFTYTLVQAYDVTEKDS